MDPLPATTTAALPRTREPLFATLAMLLCCAVLVPVAVTQEAAPAKSPAASVNEPPLYEQDPFDLLILDEANKNARYKVQPLPFPNRQLPTNRTGKLSVRLVENDADEYEISWASIRDVKLYEELLLDEALRLIGEGKTDQAFDYIFRCRNIKPDWPGLPAVMDQFLFADARNLGKSKRFAESLSVLEELYARNPEFKASATKSMLEVISDLFDRVVNEYYEKRDFRSARLLLQRMADKYKAKRPPSVDRWIEQFQTDAGKKRDEGREHLANQRFRLALNAVKEMMGIWPTVAGGAELDAEISATYPLVFVGVTQRATDHDSQRLDDWAARRTGRLLHRTLIEFLGAGPEGGQYQFPWGTIEHNEERTTMTLRLNQAAATAQPPITGYEVAQRILQIGDPTHPDYNPAWASVLNGVRVDNVTTVEVSLRLKHVLPEAWLRVPLQPRSANSANSGDGPYRIQASDEKETQFANKAFKSGGRMAEIVEVAFNDSQAAFGALQRGEVDVVDRLFPADALRMTTTLDRDAPINIEPYALPSVHLLLANTKKNPFLANRDFRRALVLAIDREKILQSELLGGMSHPGCRVVSGPFPASSGDADPLGYAYDESIRPWPHSALLGKALSIVATKGIQEVATKRKEPEPKLGKMILGHPANEIARIACQAIVAYLKVIGLEVEMREFAAGVTTDPTGECDLTYKEIAIWEPAVDARRTLGPRGVAPTDSPYVGQSLRWLDEAENWGDVRDRLIDIHRAAYNDVAVLPLWQLVDFLAYNKRVRGVGEKPVWLYQNVEQWRLSAETKSP